MVIQLEPEVAYYKNLVQLAKTSPVLMLAAACDVYGQAKELSHQPNSRHYSRADYFEECHMIIFDAIVQLIRTARKLNPNVSLRERYQSSAVYQIALDIVIAQEQDDEGP